ncbi:MAG: 1-deoxy-D-xylulose-5-phosphate reductoisomerase, partial [Candidatus Azotimanducaceae bacterium]
MRRISIFGATGSIGQNTVDLIRRSRDDYHVVALTGSQNIPQLIKDAKALRAEVAVTSDPARLVELRDGLAGSGVEAAAGDGALIEVAARPADWIMSAIVGAAGLRPGL